MKYLILIIIVMVGFSCIQEPAVPEGYIRYQTFDEYSLKGIAPDQEAIKYPCVFVKETDDTIYVIVSDQPSKVVKYINKGDYWFCQTEKDIYTDLSFKNFITNDTILSYSYIPMPRNTFTAQNIGILTKNKNTYISRLALDSLEEKNLYKSLKEITSNYKNTIPYYDWEEYTKSPDNKYPPYYYTTYIKVIKEGRLYIYNSKGTDTPVCLEDVRQLNSLGEYNPLSPPQRSIMREIANELKDEPKCK